MYTMVTKNHLFIFFAFIFIAVISSDEADESCVKMFTPEFMDEECCDTDFQSDEDMSENFEGCEAKNSDDSKEAKCESMKCYLENTGIWKDDELNNAAAKKRLENMEVKYPKNKKIAQRISKECLDGKYLKYGTEEICPAMKYIICNYFNGLLECDSWKKTEQCSKNFEYVSKCKVILDSKN